MDRRHFIVASGALALGGAARAQPSMVAAPAEGKPAPGEGHTIERRLADYAASLRYEELPRDVVEAAKRLLIDTIACAFGAIGAEPARIAEATFRKTFGGPPVASVIGGKQSISVEGAVLVNGVLTRYLDLNDIYVARDPSHPSECIPSALAVAEETGAGGRRLIEAIVIGYEAQIALLNAFSFSDRGFHSLSCAGAAVPLIAGKLWGLSPEKMVEALGVALPRAMTLMAINRGPISMMKALSFANTAMDALFATRMAAAGFTGAGNVVSWFAENVKGKRPDLAFVLEPGKSRIAHVGLKRFPLQFELQSVAEAGVALHESVRGRTTDIKEIVVETHPATIERTADPTRYNPKTRETADHSLPVCLALALIEGNVTVEQFERDRWKDAAVLALAQRVTARVSAKMAASTRGGGAHVVVTMGDGRSFDALVEIADGDPKRPMSRASLERKFMQYVVPHLGESGARRVLAMLDGLEGIADARTLMLAMRGA